MSADSDNSSPAPALSGPVAIDSPLPAVEVMRRLSMLSTRGKLPGFVKKGEREFSATVFAEPYDRRLDARVVEAGSGSRIEGGVRLKAKVPALMIGALVFTIWPGVWLTDSLMATYFTSWYPKELWVTAAWYVPLTLLALPPLWKQWTRSAVIGRGELATLIERLTEAAR